MREIWTQFSPDYEVSNLGSIRSVERVISFVNGRKRNYPARQLNQKTGTTGYPEVTIKVSGVKKTYRIHRLVAQIFLQNSASHPVVNHKDGNKRNNRVDNLEWCSYSDNLKHAYIIGLRRNEDNI
jgi:hypothetical protein